MGLVGALVSQLGDAALYFALGWAASGIGGPAAALVLSAIALPRTALLLLGGVVGDRAGAARVLIAGDGVMLVVAVVLGVVAHAWPTPLPVLLAAGLIIGTVDAFYLPSLGSMPRRLVDDGQLARAVAVRQSTSQLVTMAGAPLGGAVVAFAGLAAAAWVDAASFALVLAVLLSVRRRIAVVATSQRTESVLVAARDGLRICRRTPGLGAALLLAAGAAGFVIPSTSLLVPLLARHRHWSASTAGLMVGAQGLGVIVSTLAVARHGGARRPGIAAAGGLATAAIGQGLIAVIQSSGLVVVAAVLIGLGSGTFVANLAPVLLGAVPRTHLARVQSLLSVAQSSALLVTNNLLGAVTHWASAPVAMMCCAGGLAGCVVVALTRPTLRHLGGSEATPSDRSDS